MANALTITTPLVGAKVPSGTRFMMSGTHQVSPVVIQVNGVNVAAVAPAVQKWQYTHAPVAAAGQLILNAADASGAKASVSITITPSGLLPPGPPTLTPHQH